MMLQRSSILVLALSNFSRIWGSCVSSSHDGPQPSTRARSLPVPKGNTPSWHWNTCRGFIWHQGMPLALKMRFVCMCVHAWVCTMSVCLYVSWPGAKAKSSTGTLTKDTFPSFYLLVRTLFWQSFHSFIGLPTWYVCDRKHVRLM